MSNINATFSCHIQNPEEVEMAEDFDEFTQSSDTATDDIDSPTSGYRHASLLIQKLDSASLGTVSAGLTANLGHFSIQVHGYPLSFFILFRKILYFPLVKILCRLKKHGEAAEHLPRI